MRRQWDNTAGRQLIPTERAGTGRSGRAPVVSPRRITATDHRGASPYRHQIRRTFLKIGDGLVAPMRLAPYGWTDGADPAPAPPGPVQASADPHQLAPRFASFRRHPWPFSPSETSSPPTSSPPSFPATSRRLRPASPRTTSPPSPPRSPPAPGASSSSGPRTSPSCAPPRSPPSATSTRTSRTATARSWASPWTTSTPTTPGAAAPGSALPHGQRPQPRAHRGPGHQARHR